MTLKIVINFGIVLSLLLLEMNTTSSLEVNTGISSSSRNIISNIGKILVSLNTNLTKDKEKSGLACYNKCNESFSGFGPLCLQKCPSGFRDDGAYCFKTKSPIGRGIGYPWRAGDSLSLTEALKRCEDANGGPEKCEIWGLIVYPKCPSGYYNVDCCLCSQKCPTNMVDIGISCQKQSYWRGLGQLCINSTVINLLG